jgi:predicted permease
MSLTKASNDSASGRAVRTAALTGSVLEDLVLDLRFALRGLRRNPTFTAVAAGTIAIGMGATTAMLSIGNALLFRPPPVVEPDRLVSVWEDRSGSRRMSIEGLLLHYPRYEAYRAATSDIFEDLAGHSYRSFSVVTDEGAASVDGFVTSGNYFEVLGLTPLVGRLYDSDDEASVVLSERIWRSRFGAAPEVVGRTISVASRTFTVAGVVAREFTGTMSAFSGDIWIPAPAYARLLGIEGDEMYVVPIGRLLPGVDEPLAQERVSAAARSIPPEASNIEVRGVRLDGLLWRADVGEILTTGLSVLLAAAAVVLLIASANIAAMTVARLHDRRREVAVRLAIGAGRGRLVRQMLAEGILLALMGGAGGILLAYVGTAALSSMEFPLNVTITLDATPDTRVLVGSFAIAAMTGILFGLRPALRSTSADLTTSLKEGAHAPQLTRRRHVGVVGQVALSTLLLVTAGLFVRSFQAIADRPLGFVSEDVMVSSLSVSSDYTREEARLFFEQLLERVRALPSVESAGIGTFVLLGGSNANWSVSAVEGGDDAPRTVADYNVVDPGYFETIGIELVQGRFFTDADIEGAPNVAIVNETLGERLWPGQSALGRVMRSGDGEEHEVVGVVRDGLYVSSAESATAYAFHPFAQEYSVPMAVHVRSAGNLSSIGGEIRESVRSLDPTLALGEWRAMEQVVSMNRFGQRFIAWLATSFALIGIVLGALGVYGLLAVQVAQRSREFGVRMALGAKARDVLILVLGRGARVAAIGCAVGIGLSAVGGRWLASLLYYAVSPYDAVTFVLVPVILIGAVVLASVIPARRATRASPAATLREE